MKDSTKDSSRRLDTLSGLRPGDFPLGSPESRAAARAMLSIGGDRLACGKCLIAGISRALGTCRVPEQPDAHWDSEGKFYKNLHHSPAEHQALGISMELIVRQDGSPMLLSAYAGPQLSRRDIERAQQTVERLNALLEEKRREEERQRQLLN